MILYTSDTNKEKKIKVSSIIYYVGVIFCLIFNYVYSLFSHGVSSDWMAWAFVIPAIAGIINEISYHIKLTCNCNIARQFLAGGAVWLTLGSIFKGVLEIYGTTNRLVTIFSIVGIIQLAAALVFLITEAISFRRNFIR